MKHVKINNTNLEIAPVCFGGNVFGWTLDQRQSLEILDAFAAEGFNFIDTADTYSWWINGVGGQSETIIGNWMKSRGNRNEIVIATKVGSQTGEHPADITRKHILKSVDESLKRLQISHIDLYYTHFDDERTPVEETLSAYDEIIKAGKVRYIGASNVSVERLSESFAAAKAENLPEYAALQPHYNLAERGKFETQYAPVAEKHNLSVFPYYSLASGFLTGKYRSEADLGQSVRGGGAKKYLNGKGLGILEALDRVSAKHETTQAAVSLAWLMAQPLITAPIASATTKSQIQAMTNAVNLTLDADDLRILDSASR